VNKINEPFQSFRCEFTFCRKFDADFFEMFEKLMKDYSTLDDYCDVEVNVDG
uniref:Uncharacterized protein n=1 Tax=Panagrolaimus sp. PS1159 TaxID=55785 RepID=A0AC35EXG3_9BILA